MISANGDKSKIDWYGPLTSVVFLFYENYDFGSPETSAEKTFFIFRKVLYRNSHASYKYHAHAAELCVNKVCMINANDGVKEGCIKTNEYQLKNDFLAWRLTLPAVMVRQRVLE